MAFSILDYLFILILSHDININCNKNKKKTKLLLNVLENFKQLHIFITKKKRKKTAKPNEK